MKRRTAQEREEADAREQAEARRLSLLAELKAREAAARPSAEEAPPESTPEATSSDGVPVSPPDNAGDPTEPV